MFTPYETGMQILFTVCSFMIDAETMESVTCAPAAISSYSSQVATCMLTARPAIASYMRQHELDETHFAEDWSCVDG